MSRLPSPMQLAKSIVVFGGTQVFSVLAALVRNKVAAVMIGTAGVGLNGLFLSISTFVSNLANCGISSSCVPNLSQIYATGDELSFGREVSKVRKLSLFSATLGMLLVIVVSPLLSQIYFDDYSYLGQFSALSLVVGSTVIVNNEMSVIKSMGKTKVLAWQIILTAIISVVFVVPFFILWHIDGVIWALTSSSVANVIVVLALSNRICPIEICLEPFAQFIRSAKPLLVLGMAFVVSALFSSGAELVLQSYFEATGGLQTLGLFRAGYQMSVVYTGMIFTAINNDYYPRLSTLVDDVNERNALVWRQIKVLLAFAVPVIIIFIVVAPWLISMLYSDEFTMVTGMVRWSSLAIIVKSFCLPMGFLPIVLQKSAHYIALEISSCIILLLAEVLGYITGGLDGVGIGILFGNVVDAVVMFAVCRCLYGFK